MRLNRSKPTWVAATIIVAVVALVSLPLVPRVLAASGTVWTDFEETCLVFVGWKAERDKTIRKLKNCIIMNPSVGIEDGEK